MKRKLLAGITAAALVLGGAAILPREADLLFAPNVAEALADFTYEKNDDGNAHRFGI